MTAEDVQLLNNVSERQYELHLDGVRVSVASYYERDEVTVIPHTETLPAYGGRGLAGRLVGFALDELRSRGRKVGPACPFVAGFIAKHPEYQDLLA